MTPKTVYLLGAGVNRAVYDHHGIAPPLVTDVFSTAQRALRLEKGSPGYPTPQLLTFINQQFKVDESRLFETALNWEACLERAEGLIEKATTENERLECQKIWFELVALLGKTLGHLEIEGPHSPLMRALGAIIWAEQATVLTFNYDTVIEQVIESASGLPQERISCHEADVKIGNEFEKWISTSRKPPGPEIPLDYRKVNWSRALGYGVSFDELPVDHPSGMPQEVEGKAFFGRPKNAPHSLKVLKLHGSLNWFTYTDTPRSTAKGMPTPDLSLKGRRILHDHGWLSVWEWPNHKGFILDPMIVTGKDKARRLLQDPFPRLWEQAELALRECDRLVIIGYSFSDPTTDDLIGRAIDSAHPPIVEWVMPSSQKITETARRLGIGYEMPHSRTVEEYVWCHPLIRNDRLGQHVRHRPQPKARPT